MKSNVWLYGGILLVLIGLFYGAVQFWSGKKEFQEVDPALQFGRDIPDFQKVVQPQKRENPSLIGDGEGGYKYKDLFEDPLGDEY